MASAKKRAGFLTFRGTNNGQLPIEEDMLVCLVMQDSFWAMVNVLSLECGEPRVCCHSGLVRVGTQGCSEPPCSCIERSTQ